MTHLSAKFREFHARKLGYIIYSSVLSNVSSVINFDNSHCEINSVISLSDFLPPIRYNFDINPPIKKKLIYIENFD